MRTAMVVLVVLTLVFAVSVSALELLTPVAMAGAPETLFLAYSDNTVWWAHGTPLEIPAANRGIPVRLMHPYANGVLVLYDDNLLYVVTTPNGCQSWADMTRPDDVTLKPVLLTAGSGLGIVATYGDGQIWSYAGGQLNRVEMWERLNPTSDSDGHEATALPGVFPNPSTRACNVLVRVPIEGPVSVDLVDATGRLVRHLLDGPHPAEDYSLKWDGKDDAGRELPAGVYFTHVTTAGGTTTGRVVLAR